MSQLRLKVYYRNVWSEILFLGGEAQIRRLSWSAMGGCKEGMVTITPKEDYRGSTYAVERSPIMIMDAWVALELLRCPVVVVDERSHPVWWGYVSGSKVDVNKISIGVTLEKMVNRVKVVYTNTEVAGEIGERADSDWSQDDLSISEYGTREGIFSLSQGNADEAAQRVSTLLERLKYPMATRQFGNFGAARAELQLAGWFGTLDWKYFEDISGKEGFEETGQGIQAFGNTTATSGVGQSFQLESAASWEANVIKVRLSKQGDPTDNITLQLRNDSSGVPGSTVYASATIAGEDVPEYINWVTAELSTRVALSTGTTYWITMERSGSIDADNYYKTDGDEDLGYTRGAFKIWNGSSWVARDPDMDMLFAVSGVEETSQQASDIATECGQFFEGISLQVASGVYTCPYRDGDQTGLSEFLALMNSGTSNNRRMLARVDEDRTLVISEEPAVDELSYLIDSEAKMYDWGGNKLEPWRYPVGVWARLKNVIPNSLNTSYLADPTMVFIEDVIYDADRNQAQIRERASVRFLEVE